MSGRLMTTFVPALLAATSAGVLVGIPAPSRLDLLGARTARVLPVRTLRLLGPLAALAVVAVVAGPGGAAVTALLAVVGTRARTRWQRARDREVERAGAVEALAVLASELRAGRMPADALGAAAGVAAGTLASTFAVVATGASVGADPSVALLRSAEASAVPELLRGLAACWQVCSATGSSLAAAVDRLAEALRAERAQRLAVEAELAGPRATAVLLAVLPIAGIALAAGLGARPLHVLLHTGLGLGCLAAGVGLDLLGLWWTGRIVAAAGGDG
jgi:tight adherence protein B